MMCNNINYKFEDHTFTSNMEYYKSIETTNYDSQKAKNTVNNNNNSSDRKKKTMHKRGGCRKSHYDYCKMKNHIIENCCKHKRNTRNRKLKSSIAKGKDVMAINNNLKEINLIKISQATLDKTAATFEDLAKKLKITKVSELFSLITKCTKQINHTNINNLVTEVIKSVYNYSNSVDKVGDNKYLELFTLLKCVLIDACTSHSIIKKKCMLKLIHDLKKRTHEILSHINGGNFLMSHEVPLTFVSSKFCSTKEIACKFAVDET